MNHIWVQLRRYTTQCHTFKIISLKNICLMIVPADVVPVTSVLLNTAAGGLCLVWVWPALSQHGNTRVWGGGRGGGEEYPGHSCGHLVIAWITVAELSLVTSIPQSVFTVGWEARYGETIVITNTGRPAAVDIRVELCLVEEHRDPCHTQARHRLKYCCEDEEIEY